MLFPLCADFAPLLGFLQTTSSSLTTIDTDISAQISSTNGFTPTNPSTASAMIAELEAFLVILEAGNTSMTTAQSTAQSLRDSIDAASVSASPYASQSDTLGPNLLEARTKTVEAMDKIIIATRDGIARYSDPGAIISDINLQIFNINNPEATVAVSITEAQDELIEAIADATGKLEVVDVSVTEAIADLPIRVSAVQGSLNGIASPSPAFSTAVNTFLSFTP